MRSEEAFERRSSIVAVIISIAFFVGLLAVVSPLYRSFDEAKYLGIGYSMFAGHGPRTVFGAVFLPHSPLWSVVVAAPDVWFGIDAFAWGHLLNAVAAAALLLLVATLGWPIRPAVSALAVVGYLAVPYLHDLTRTARLDVPAAALALAYIVVGIDAVRRGSVRRGAIAGAVFAVAFLVKEIALPFAPVPFLVGILVGRPLTSIARVAASTVLAAGIGVSWWLVLFAQYTQKVYRLGTPAWTLWPLVVAGALVVCVGFAAPVLARRPSVIAVAGRIRAALPSRVRDHGRTLAGWGLGFAWFLALTVFFDRNGELKGNGLFQPGQYALYLQKWLPQLLPIVVFGAVGVALSLMARRHASRPARDRIDALLMAVLCSAPLILLVIAVGEPPRNYLAQIGILITLAAAGWLWALEASLASGRMVVTMGAFVVVGGAAGAILAQAIDALPLWVAMPAGVVVGLAVTFRRSRLGIRSEPAPATSGEQPRVAGATLVATLVAIFFVASTVLGQHALKYRDSPSGAARAAAVSAASGWIEANLPPGTKVGFGSFLGYETALDVAAGFPMVQLHQALAVVDPAAPMGLAPADGPPVDDWLAIDTSRREREFYAFRGSTFAQAVKASGISFYIYHTGPTTSVPSLLGALTPDHGFTEVASWSFPVLTADGASTTTETHVFAVDQSRVDFADAPVFAPAAALAQLVELLEVDPSLAARAAANLATAISVWPDPAAGAVLVDRLRALAGRGSP